VSAIPKPPAWLSREAKAVWCEVAPILHERKVLTKGDLGTLESYCTATGTVREMQKVINRDGSIVFIKGIPKRHPALGIQNAAMTTARLCAEALGLTPVSRSRPAMRDEPEAENEFDI
jgi:P27 family predicted phage terminase small subunit